MLEWLNMVNRGSQVKRFHTVQTIGIENVGEHSFMVAAVCLELTDHKASAELLRAALFHDLPESEFGDIPAPAKWAFPILKCSLDVMEEEFLSKHNLNIDLPKKDLEVLKCADMISLLLYCISQMNLGNKNMIPVFERGLVYMDTIPKNEKCVLLLEHIKNYKGAF